MLHHLHRPAGTSAMVVLVPFVAGHAGLIAVMILGCLWYLIGYHEEVLAATTIRTARRRADLSLRAMASRATTSHATLSAYERGHKVPSTETLDRIVRSAGFDLRVTLVPRPGGTDPADRGQELEEVLHLAAQFPARHDRHLPFPPFPAAHPSTRP